MTQGGRHITEWTQLTVTWYALTPRRRASNTLEHLKECVHPILLDGSLFSMPQRVAYPPASCYCVVRTQEHCIRACMPICQCLLTAGPTEATCLGTVFFHILLPASWPRAQALSFPLLTLGSHLLIIAQRRSYAREKKHVRKNVRKLFRNETKCFQNFKKKKFDSNVKSAILSHLLPIMEP